MKWLVKTQNLKRANIHLVMRSQNKHMQKIEWRTTFIDDYLKNIKNGKLKVVLVYIIQT